MKKLKKENDIISKINCEKVTDIYVFVMLLLFPLIVGIKGYSDIEKTKAYFFFITTGLWLLSLILILSIEIFKKKGHNIKFNLSYAFILLFLVISFISALFSSYKPETFLFIGRYEGFITTLLYVLIFLGISLFTKPKRIFMWGMGISLSLCLIVSVIQLLNINIFGLFPGNYNYYNKSFLGTIGNVDLFSAYLCLVVPILFIYSLKTENKKDHFLLFPSLIALIFIYLIYVRSSIIAFIGTILFTIPVLINNSKKAKIVFICILGLISIGLVRIYFYDSTKNMTLYQVSEIMHGNMEDRFGNGRGLIWKKGFKIFLEHPLLGTGPGTTSKVINIYKNKPNPMIKIQKYVDNAHNAYLGYLINIGIFGTLSYILFLLSCLITWINKRKNNYYLALGCGVLCYIIQDFFNLNTIITAPMLFIVLGLLINNNERKLENE